MQEPHDLLIRPRATRRLTASPVMTADRVPSPAVPPEIGSPRTILTPGRAHMITSRMTSRGIATQPAVLVRVPMQCRKMQLPRPGTPSRL